jgi:hypothetical protein
MLAIILYIFAFVLFIVASFYGPVARAEGPWRLHVGWLALAFFTAGVLVDKGVL